MPDAEYLTIQEAAQLLRTSPHAIYNQRHRGDLPGALGVKVGARLLFRRSDLDAFFADRAAAAFTDAAARRGES